MAEEANYLRIEGFAGMAPTVEPADAQERFSEVQINVQSPRLGELTSRPGLQSIIFDD
jgi:hypothetical protein